MWEWLQWIGTALSGAVAGPFVWAIMGKYLGKRAEKLAESPTPAEQAQQSHTEADRETTRLSNIRERTVAALQEQVTVLKTQVAELQKQGADCEVRMAEQDARHTQAIAAQEARHSQEIAELRTDLARLSRENAALRATPPDSPTTKPRRKGE